MSWALGFRFCLVLIACCVSSVSLEQQVDYCKSCREKRILAVRGQILTKLGLTESKLDVEQGSIEVPQDVLNTFNAVAEERAREFRAEEAADLVAQYHAQEEYFAKEIVRLRLVETRAAAMKIAGLSATPIDTYTLKFNTSTLPSDGSQITRAQLLLHMIPTNKATPRTKADAVLDVCEGDELNSNGSTIQGCSGVRDSKKISSRKAVWVSFDVTPIARKWYNQKIAEGGVKVTIRGGDGTIASSSTVTLDGGQRSKYSAHILAWVMPGGRAEATRRRRRRSSLNWKFCQSRPKERRCCLRSLYIDFRRDLNWTWIHAPPGYHANYCTGSCPFLWGTGSKHHTTVMALYSKTNPDAPGDPCCVARSYKPLVILHYKDGKPKIQELKNMAVSRCACL